MCLIVATLTLFFALPLAIVGMMTRGGTRPMDRRLTETPATFGSAYEDVSFLSLDGVELKGWYLSGGYREVCVILCHGRFRSRREVLRQAINIWEDGYNVLLFDFRHHGESQRRQSTFGFEERKDIHGAVRYLHEQRKTKDRLVVYGISMGGAAAVLAAAETPAIEAVIVDSIFRSLRDTVGHHIKTFLHLPAWPLTEIILFWARAFAGIDSRAFDLEAAILKLGRRPILFIAGATDRRMPPSISTDLYQKAASPRKALMIVPGAAHGQAYRANPQRYRDGLLEFLEMAFK